MASSPTKQHVNRLERLVRELLQKERDYIDTLEKGIYNYVRPVAMKTFDKFEVPNEIRNQKFKLFGNIEEICLLHKSTVLPRLLSCGDNIYQISETLINLIQSDAFYCYIDYAINHKQAEQLLSSHANFFASLQKTCNDRLGVLSFIIQPIQKIPRYPLILEEMIKELSKDMHMNKKALASLCIAKKNIEKFLARLNQALTINDIIETHEVNTSLQCGLITCLQIEFGVNINEPTLLIVPSFTSNHGYRQSVKDFEKCRLNYLNYHYFQLNVYKLGKFITTEHLDVSENLNAPKAFPCKIFLFEQCLLYTKVINHNGQNLLSYRDHFTFGSNFVMSLKRTQQMLIVGDIISNRYVSFTASDYEAVLELYDFVKSLYHPRYSNDSLKSLEYPRYSSDSAFAEGNEMNLEVPNIDEDEIVVNESMADNDWVVTDIDMIRESCVDDDISDEVDFWVPRQFLKSFGMCKTQGKKKVLETSNSRFYVESPETTFN